MRLLFLPTVFLMVVASDAADPSNEDLMIVAAFGTSLTNRGGWLQPLQDKLTSCLGRQVSVLDLGSSGVTSEWSLSAVGSVIRSVRTWC